MGQKSYLRVDGIRGSSSDLGHIGELEIDQFSYSYGQKSRSERVKLTVRMELESSFVILYQMMMNHQKVKDATLTVENRDQFNRLSLTYKAEMRGLEITEVKSITPRPDDGKNQIRTIQSVAFLVDTIETPKFAPRPETTDDWKVD